MKSARLITFFKALSVGGLTSLLVFSSAVVQAHNKHGYHEWQRYEHNRWHHHRPYRDHSYGDRRYHDYPRHNPHRDRYHGGRDYDDYGPRCYKYKVFTRGGTGGFRRMDNIDGFYQFGGHAHRGKICGSGRVKIELSKRDTHTTTVFVMNGRRIVFRAGEHADRVKNNWYRKYYTVRLPRKHRDY